MSGEEKQRLLSLMSTGPTADLLAQSKNCAGIALNLTRQRFTSLAKDAETRLKEWSLHGPRLTLTEHTSQRVCVSSVAGERKRNTRSSGKSDTPTGRDMRRWCPH